MTPFARSTLNNRHVWIVCVQPACDNPVMAAGTIRAYALGCMIEGCRRPCQRIDGVAITAIGLRRQMVDTLAAGNVIVVTAVACSHDLAVIDCRCKHCKTFRRMATFTGFGAADVVIAFARSDVTIVTTLTTANNLVVVNQQRCRKTTDRVAAFAGFGRTDVVRVLASRFLAIVAAGAVAGQVLVINSRGQPGGGGMTLIAFSKGLRVIFVLACCDVTIVTAGTTAENLSVIKDDNRFPPRFLVAVLALIGCLDVIQGQRRRLHQAATAVATGALPGSAFEHAGDMAGRAVNSAVRAFQGEPGCKMIKI